jgi:dTDP-glucose 4,6-dehydratase
LFYHISTDEVYGSLKKDDGAFTEDNQYQPNSPYSASKASSDHLVRAWHHTYKLPVLTSNCSNNYGPFQFPEKLIPLTIINALSGMPIPIYGDGLNIRDWLYVTDHCSAIETILHNGKIGEIYNIGGNNEKTNMFIVESICNELEKIKPSLQNPNIKDGSGYFDLIKYVDDRPGHDFRYSIDSSKLSKNLNWVPAESFESGIVKTVKWYVDNQNWIDSTIKK